MQTLLKYYYGIEVQVISEQQGGWAARAFRVSTEDKQYFLKVYDKARPSTAKWTALIDYYTPVLLKLSDTTLKGYVPVPILTNAGSYKCEDTEAIYLLYEYIDGYTIAERDLTEEQVVELGHIVGQLHQQTLAESVGDSVLVEDFEAPFNTAIAKYVEAPLSPCVEVVIAPYKSKLQRLVQTVDRLRQVLQQTTQPFVLCHTDIHKWNLMQTQERVILIDWEGMKYAPKEADFFALMDLPCYDSFLATYRQYHSESSIDTQVDAFYQNRRKAEDIWEYIEQLEYQTLEEDERQAIIGALIEECETL